MFDDHEYMDALLYCLEQKFPYPVTVSLLAMVVEDFDEDDTELLEAAWYQWRRTSRRSTRMYRPTFEDKRTFLLAVNEVTGEGVVFCDDCTNLTWADYTTEVQGERKVCDARCADEYFECYGCNDLVRTTTYGDGHDYCDTCYSDNFSYCEDCDTSYANEYANEHDHSGCQCEAPHPEFTFPANGDGVVEQDQRITVELPKGIIDEEGMNKIKRVVWEEIHDTGIDFYTDLDNILHEVGTQWQGKRGNFTKRLGAALFRSRWKIKLTPATISEIGNLSKQHSSKGASWRIEFTRDLNMSAGEFCHDDSCWWGGYFASRCSLKQWGGLGMRSFNGDDSWPTGRVWVQPLHKGFGGVLTPTHDTINADAYVVFNAYGELSGFIAARIIAHFTGMTYKKVGMSANTMYVNNNQAVLVSDEETCKNTESLTISADEHHTFDARTIVRLAA